MEEVINPLNTAKSVEEVEILTFKLDDKSFGVEVAQVKEILKATHHITPMPGIDSRVIGVFMPRDELISCVDLKKCLFGVDSENEKVKYMIICILNELKIAFTCEDVKDIKRYRKDEFIDPPDALTEENLITSILKSEDDIVNIINFDHIINSICLDNSLMEETMTTEAKAS